MIDNSSIKTESVSNKRMSFDVVDDVFENYYVYLTSQNKTKITLGIDIEEIRNTRVINNTSPILKKTQAINKKDNNSDSSNDNNNTGNLNYILIVIVILFVIFYITRGRQ
jgi:hypothetical protein